MNDFTFYADDEAHSYCMDIVNEMVQLFGITKQEAVGRVNRHWSGLRIEGDEDLIYHEDVDYWANTIYYGKESEWWTDPPDKRPLPYP